MPFISGLTQFIPTPHVSLKMRDVQCSFSTDTHSLYINRAMLPQPIVTVTIDALDGMMLPWFNIADAATSNSIMLHVLLVPLHCSTSMVSGNGSLCHCWGIRHWYSPSTLFHYILRIKFDFFFCSFPTPRRPRRPLPIPHAIISVQLPQSSRPQVPCM